jgi:hypothetical protein
MHLFMHHGDAHGGHGGPASDADPGRGGTGTQRQNTSPTAHEFHNRPNGGG